MTMRICDDEPFQQMLMSHAVLTVSHAVLSSGTETFICDDEPFQQMLITFATIALIPLTPNADPNSNPNPRLSLRTQRGLPPRVQRTGKSYN